MHTECDEDKAMAFTRVELLVVIGTLALLALLAVPVLANGKAGSQRAVCAGNLARIGRAFAIWGTDHGALYPSQVFASNGGTRNHPSGLNNNIWFQFAWVSNELATPKILACPSDPAVRVAGDFSFSSPDGFLKPGNQNNAVSYIMGWPYQEDGRLVFSGDRNISVNSFGGGSISGLNPIAWIDPDSPDLRWLPGTTSTGIHPIGGNLLFNDGSVEQTDDAGLRSAMSPLSRLGSTGVNMRSEPYFQYPRIPFF
jgi:type II secretory pathway pseudopilin PulG